MLTVAQQKHNMPESLDQLVVERGLVTQETLIRARLVKSETGERLDAVLTRLGLISEQALANAIADVTGLAVATASSYPQQALDLANVTPRFLRDAKAVPLQFTPHGMDVAFIDPFDPYPMQALRFACGQKINPVVAKSSDLESALDRLYGAVADYSGDIDSEADDIDLERLKDLASDAPVIRAVNRLIARAVEERASDIHIEPNEDGLAVRFRIDGAMRDIDPLPATMKLAFVSRIKVMSGLNIAEKRLPQDGRLRLAVRGHDIDLRVATSPTIHGESVVMRILDRSNLALQFDTLGFDQITLNKYLPVLKRPHGIVLVTGPTGSGKTTTLYASLSELNTTDRKILTVEDPIEYRLGGISQTQVSAQIGLNFAAALRSFLRQDPDVMMVGEIRDLETAQVAVQAALTGHTILSTLHTNTAASAVTRLLDMGVEPFLITSTLNAVLAQRLVRRLCPHCKEAFKPTRDALETIDSNHKLQSIVTLYKPVGCDNCGHTGFRGRVALLELLVMDEAIGQLVLHRAEAREIQRTAIAAGMRTMLEDGIIKAEEGQTTIEEVLRVTREA